MNRNLIKTAFAVIVVAMAASCAREGIPVSPDPEPKGVMDVAFRGIIKGYEPLDESKASAENVIRIKWQGGETVYIYEGKNYLGLLTASIEGTDGLYAKLSGTITAPSGGKAVTLVYSPNFSGRPDTYQDGVISLKLSTQSDKEVPFLIYSVVDSLEGSDEGSEISDKVVTFKLATSVYKCNCADLPEGTVSSATIDYVNTKCIITLSDDDTPAIGGSDPGTITRTAGFTAADHRVIFSVALAPGDAEKNRTITVTKDRLADKIYDAAFYREALEAAKAYNAVYVFKPLGALPGKFSVNSSGGQVYFAKGNLWNGEYMQCYFEDNQWDIGIKIDPSSKNPTWVNDHRSHFYWSKDQNIAYFESYSDEEKSADDVFFTNASPTTPNLSLLIYFPESRTPQGVWRTLSGGDEEGEWYYLLEKRRMTFNKPRYTNSTGEGVAIEDSPYRGLFIYPDDYNGDVIVDNKFTWEQINAAGIAFLPAAGYRSEGNVSYLGERGCYWSASADGTEDAYNLVFDKTSVDTDDVERYWGHSVRMVRDYK